MPSNSLLESFIQSVLVSMSHVFISYSHKDSDYVHILQRHLEEQGFNIWVDERIDYGMHWPREIEKRLQECAAFILIMSPNSYESDWVQRELNFAQQLKKPLFPLLLEGDVWWHVGTTQFIDVKNGILPPTRFLGRLAQVASRRPASESPDDVDELVEKKPVKREAVGQVEPISSYPNQKEPQKAGQRLKTKYTVVILGAAVALMAGILGYPLIGKWLAANPAPTATMALNMPPATYASTALPTQRFTPAPAPTETMIPAATPYPTEISDIDPSGNPVLMRLVPAGEFTMGTEKGKVYGKDESDAQPVHQVYLDAFYMDKFEVTNALYKACVEAGTCQPPMDSRHYNNSSYSNHPVVYVHWQMADNYCYWRGAQLPTEAQWEKAARGTDGRTFPWGEGLNCSKANYCNEDTTEVGSYPSGVSPYGLFDMAGNVWEWVTDYYSETYYQNSPASNPLGPSPIKYRVLRGGAWGSSDFYQTSFDRYHLSSAYFGSKYGFRCVRSIPEEGSP
jgi:formylglycine-generating enzyme required for sulfatase activity